MRHGLLLQILLLLFFYTLVAHADNEFRVLHTFADKPAISLAYGVVFGPSGVAFGVGAGGNPTCTPGNGCGTVYSLSQAKDGTWNFTIIYQFKGGADGWMPSGRLLVDSKGDLYGTTWFGGSQASGTIFELTPSRDRQRQPSADFHCEHRLDVAAAE